MKKIGETLLEKTQKELIQRLRSLLLREEIEDIYLLPVAESYLMEIESMARDCHHWCQSPAGRQLFEKWLVESLASGQIAKALYCLARFGRFFSQYSYEGPLKKELFVNWARHLMMRAIKTALHNGNYGVAALLAETVGLKTEEVNKYREKAQEGHQVIDIPGLLFLVTN